MKTRWQLYKELELISDAQPQSRTIKPTHQSWLGEVWDALDVALFRDLEPRVWQTVDYEGRSCWHAYDPETGQTIHLNSAADIRTWLEQLFLRY